MMQKLVIRTGIAISALALSVAPAFAATVEASNSTTGSHSHNSVDIDLHSSNSVNQSNDSHITNDITVKNNTGGNTANDNTGNGDVHTGGASTDVGIENTGNVNTAPDTNCGCEDHFSVDAMNDHTGSHSHNRINVDVSKRRSLRQSNRSRINNLLDLMNSTGHNRANDNTGDGSVDTGGSDTFVDVLNDVNHNQ